jgi:excinuclease ABC subunit A
MNHIHIKGANEHNLKNIELNIPRNKLVVITGLSGSGKSSLAFDTIYAEGQRRYVESLSAYARQFLDKMEKPDVELIEGLSPAIAIEQKTTHKNPRSTVATVTEIYDYMRILFARAGIPHCPKCGKVIQSLSSSEIAKILSSLKENTKITITAPIVRDKKGEFKKLFSAFLSKGFTKAYVDGEIALLDNPPQLEKNIKHSISLIVDRIKTKAENRTRIAEAVELALNLSDGLVEIINHDENNKKLYSEHFACIDCNIFLPEFQPRSFSFNSPHGACPHCHGIGNIYEFDEELLIDKTRSISQGALLPYKNPEFGFRSAVLKALSEQNGFSLNIPFNKLPKEMQKTILYGTSNSVNFVYESKSGIKYHWNKKFEGLIPELTRRYKETKSNYIREELEKFMSSKQCAYCKGKRLKSESLAVTIDGKNIIDFTDLSVEKCLNTFKNLKLNNYQKKIAEKVQKEIVQRLEFLNSVGLSYLTLSRNAGTLSGGEAQRIRLATQIGSKLMGVVYVLDEPSIGLHQRDNGKLINTLLKMKQLGNTVIVVEHDEETINNADFVVDLGPGAGEHGGNIVFAGTPKQLKKSADSLTGKYLSGKLNIEVPKKRRKATNFLEIKNASKHNLQHIDVKIPLSVFSCVTGVSGSGKSTLINGILKRGIARKLNNKQLNILGVENILGTKHIDKIISIDQSPIGRTPRSNPATYTGLFTPIRELFAKTTESRIRGYKPGRFSFNVKGGRCEKCSGDGTIKIEMHFLPDVYITCEECKGQRYNRETLEIKYKGKNIAEVLNMTVEEALDFFHSIPLIKSKLQTLQDVGLSYIRLGQPATTLSGGEAQRIKLSKELSKKATGKTLYLLDEPTTGLHFEDIKKLLSVLNRLVDAGNSLVVIEHNLDVIKSADHIIDLGPDGGDKGGKVVVSGTPEEVAAHSTSYTGQYLRQVLK